MNHTAADVTVLARTLRDLSSQGSQEMFTGPVGDDETHARGHEGGLLLCNAAVSKQRVAQEGPLKGFFNHVCTLLVLKSKSVFQLPEQRY